MQRKSIWSGMFFAAVCLLTATSLASEKPWSERAITEHVAQAELIGTLSRQALEKLKDRGEVLFTAKFTRLDGAGRPLATSAIIPTKRKRVSQQLFNRIAGTDANACSSCHNEPRVGGAGNFTTNVFVSEGFNNQGEDSTDPQFSNERNTNHLMGAGLIELLAREMTAELVTLRKQALRLARQSGQVQIVRLVTKGVDFGLIKALPDGLVDLSSLEGIDNDLVVRPFSQKGVMTSLRQFTINALNQHHGMQATERFGIRWTGTDDFDGDDVRAEISAGDVSALVAWQATLAPPNQMKPESKLWQEAANKGAELFDQAGCSFCHIRELPLNSLEFVDPGPVDAAGTLRNNETGQTSAYNLGHISWARELHKNAKGQFMVPLFGDLKRHVMSDAEVSGLGNELLSQRFVERSVFQTTELWGIGSTAPYGHRGDMTTLVEVIEAHGGEARASRDKYMTLADEDRDRIIAFLKTLVISR